MFQGLLRIVIAKYQHLVKTFVWFFLPNNLHCSVVKDGHSFKHFVWSLFCRPVQRPVSRKVPWRSRSPCAATTTYAAGSMICDSSIPETMMSTRCLPWRRCAVGGEITMTLRQTQCNLEFTMQEKNFIENMLFFKL